MQGPIPTGWMRIEAGYFVAGLYIYGNVVTKAAPIISYMMGWDYAAVIQYVRKKKWHYQFVKGD